jgi:hypothetical protein
LFSQQRPLLQTLLPVTTMCNRGRSPPIGGLGGRSLVVSKPAALLALHTLGVRRSRTCPSDLVWRRPSDNSQGAAGGNSVQPIPAGAGCYRIPRSPPRPPSGSFSVHRMWLPGNCAHAPFLLRLFCALSRAAASCAAV